jgi:hypothetical protein
MKVGDVLGYTGAFLWSTSGVGAAIGLPTALILAITGVVNKIIALIKKEAAKGPYSENVEFCRRAAVLCLIAAVPIIGGPFVFYVLKKTTV